ncbi:hypothetical protein GCM10008905_13820 [Clostridium malenominatum]|uniref:Regulatory protein BlaR1 n=1 Tax=Clostridium malenominatum TaxID=1539 RepID=A0ABP3U3P2_9CLOT
MESIINVTITTSITSLIILSIKALLKNKISPKWQFSLWIIVALRLLVPVLPESNMSIFNAVPQIKNVEVSERALESIGSETRSYITGDIVVGEKDKEFILSNALVQNAVTIWIAGSIIMFIYITGTYFIYHRKTRKLIVLEGGGISSVLEECKRELGINHIIKVRMGGETPLLKGLFNPEIILPEGYTNKELKSVFTHELMHYKHKDILWNVISILLLCIYWYNPIMWFSFFQFRRDMEILCDYRVLEIYNNRKEYAEVLLKTALRKNKFLLCTTSMQNGEKDISKRIKYIAYFKKPKVFWSTIAAIVAIIITSICLTNPVGKAFNVANGLDYGKIYEHKTLYVGDASKVGNLTDKLYYGEYKKGFELQTDSKPYGATINYLIKPGELSQNGVLAVTDKMMKNAAIMFCLIDNVDEITFAFNDGSGIYRFPFNRKLFNEVFNKDIREYATSLQSFKNEFIPMIYKQNWNDVKVPIDNLKHDVKDKVEKNLKVIMSSPKSSSNPQDYIEAHHNEYHNILKMGEEALQYMLTVFESKEVKGIKAHIMMSLCIDLLGDRNNVKEGSYSSPDEWYEKLSPYTASKLPPFKYETSDKIEQMVYLAALEKYSAGKGNITHENTVTIVAPHIFGTYEDGNQLKIFTTVYYNGFKLYDKTLSQDGAGVVPAAIIYTKNNDGTYTFKKYVEAMDGTYFKRSIEDFCKPRSDIAKAIMNHYGNDEDLFRIMRSNLIKYLKDNKMEGIKIKENNGEIVTLT